MRKKVKKVKKQSRPPFRELAITFRASEGGLKEAIIARAYSLGLPTCAYVKQLARANLMVAGIDWAADYKKAHPVKPPKAPPASLQDTLRAQFGQAPLAVAPLAVAPLAVAPLAEEVPDATATDTAEDKG